MSNLSVLRNALKLNADVITMLQFAILEFKNEAAKWKEQGETAFFIAACEDRRKHEKKLAKAVEMQRRTKTEITALIRKDNIRRLYIYVFAKVPEQQLYTSHEQHAMLSALASERRAALRADKKATKVAKAA